MKKLLTGIFFIFLAVASLAQNSIQDLINQLPEAKEDTAKVKLLITITKKAASINPPEAMKFSIEAVSLAELLNYPKGEANAKHQIGNCYYMMNDRQEALRFYIEALEIRKQIDDKEGISSSYNNIGNVYQEVGEIEKAIEYQEKGLEINKQLNNREWIAFSHYNIGKIFNSQGKYNKALIKFKTAIKIFEEIKHQQGVSWCYNDMGIIYENQGYYDKAIEFYLKSLSINEQINDKKAIAASYNNIGIISGKQGNFDKALDYYFKSLAIKKETNDKKGIADTYNNIGLIFLEKSKADSSNYSLALNYYNKSLTISNEINNVFGIASATNNIGLIYNSQKKYDKAIEAYKKSLEIRQRTGDQKGTAYAYNGIGECYLKQKQYKQAIKYFEKGYKIGKKIGAYDVQKFTSKGLSESFAALGKFEKAFHYQSIFKQTSDSLNNMDNIKKITQMSMQYEFQKKLEQQEFEQKQKDLANQERLQRQKLITYSFVGGFLLMLMLAFVVFRSYRIKKKDNKLLAEQKEEILQKNAVLNQQNEEIEAQRDEIERQRDYVIKQRDQIAEQKEQITDSITYASRIQTAVLPPEETIEQVLPEHFVLFRPKDIVSGDFYWMSRKKHKTIIVAADCTGHGVPGAFMSMLGVSFLNEIVNKENVLQANYILNNLREEVKKSLRQTGKDGEAKDGMDMALCIIDHENMSLQFAGANNPLIHIRNNELLEYKADRMPIGIYIKDKQSFTNHEIDLEVNDIFYIFSDGYPDQFGGKKSRKFMIKRFKELLLKISPQNLNEQREILNNTIDKWRGEIEQIDDILVIGFKITN